MATTELGDEGQGVTKVVERNSEPTRENVTAEERSTEPAEGLE